MRRKLLPFIFAGAALIAMALGAAFIWFSGPGESETLLPTPLPAAGAPTVSASTVSASTVSAAPGSQRFVIVPADSQVIYRVEETLIREGNRLNIAVGVTKGIQGEIAINRSDPRQSRIGTLTIDISKFTSDSARRDQAIRERWLESARFPTATFTPTSIQGLPASYRDGQELKLQIAGNLRVRDVMRPTAFQATIKLSGNTLTGFATGNVLMTDFGFDPPSILGILRAENVVAIEFTFAARAQ